MVYKSNNLINFPNQLFESLIIYNNNDYHMQHFHRKYINNISLLQFQRIISYDEPMF